MQGINAISVLPIGSSVDDIEKLYDSFYTQRLADECRFLVSDIKALKEVGTDNAKLMARDLNRRLRIARRLLAKRQLKMF